MHSQSEPFLGPPAAPPLSVFEVELRCRQTGFHQGTVEIHAVDDDDASLIAGELHPGCYAAEFFGPWAA
jgi:hypothetical protein